MARTRSHRPTPTSSVGPMPAGARPATHPPADLARSVPACPHARPATCLAPGATIASGSGPRAGRAPRARSGPMRARGEDASRGPDVRALRAVCRQGHGNSDRHVMARGCQQGVRAKGRGRRPLHKNPAQKAESAIRARQTLPTRPKRPQSLAFLSLTSVSRSLDACSSDSGHLAG